MVNRIAALGPSVPCPAKRKPTYLRVLPVRPGEGLKGVFLSPEFIGVNMHFISTRTIICTAHRGVCPCCTEGIRTRWYGFAAVAVRPLWQPGILQLTTGAVQHNALLQVHLGDLRGRGFHATRRGKSMNSAMACTVEEKRPLKEEMPNPDLAYCLCCLFGLRADELDGPCFGLFDNGKGGDE